MTKYTYTEITWAICPEQNPPKTRPSRSTSAFKCVREKAKLPRTNNSVVGRHRLIQASLDCYHPIFRMFIKLLQEEQGQQKVHRTYILAGHALGPDRVCNQDCSVNMEKELPCMGYLRSIAHNISL